MFGGGHLQKEATKAHSGPLSLGVAAVAPHRQAANIDELMAHHSAFLAHCMDAFLLNNPHLFKVQGLWWKRAVGAEPWTGQRFLTA